MNLLTGRFRNACFVLMAVRALWPQATDASQPLAPPPPPFTTRLDDHVERSASRTECGWVAAIFRRVLAAPLGLLVCCSHFCRVRTLTPMSWANLVWLRPMALRIAAGSGSLELLGAAGNNWPFSIRNFTRSSAMSLSWGGRPPDYRRGSTRRQARELNQRKPDLHHSIAR